ncbi:MAG: cryptochrome/photolyase family protein [Brevundimonas sp.]|uniref:cryptochrome/photolyase family protein n=1 Tax=Brevundimonas sp. TaxID=1871086 RepID=UPI00391C37A3
MSSSRSRPVIVWFRRDLRIADNPALTEVAATGAPVIPLYIHDPALDGRPMGAASGWWLDKSLRALATELEERGAPLLLRSGDPEATLRVVINETGADAVLMNRMFEPAAWERDAEIAHGLKADGVACRGFNGTMLARPGSVRTGQDAPYRVFTPFLKALLDKAEEPAPRDGPRTLDGVAGLTGEAVDDWGLHPLRPDWSTGFDWTPGESGAREALSRFLAGPLTVYGEGRDIPGEDGTSRLSPHLHFGEISPWRAIRAARQAAKDGRVPGKQAEKFVSEVGWREFSTHLLHHFPYMAERAFRPEFEAMAWRDDGEGLEAWKRGMTGYPVVDAGMRQLWATGWMHNRVRMIVASFLVKDLLVDWREGEAWFWDTLVDADMGANIQNWQWVAGSGADAAPYFRIFNPVTQGEKFDGEGKYVRRWVPELAGLSDRWIHAPWTAPTEVLAAAGIRLGRDYPAPIVDHAMGRKRALDALEQIKSARDKD